MSIIISEAITHQSLVCGANDFKSSHFHMKRIAVLTFWQLVAGRPVIRTLTCDLTLEITYLHTYLHNQHLSIDIISFTINQLEKLETAKGA